MNKIRQENICSFVKEYLEKNGKPPTVREIGAAVGISSSSTVAGYLNRMVRDGKLKKTDEARNRCYKITA